jgi:hypothetical protein
MFVVLTFVGRLESCGATGGRGTLSVCSASLHPGLECLPNMFM